MNSLSYVYAFNGILYRELYRFLQQRSRLFSALVRPLLWLIVFAAGFRAALGISIIPPYQTYITYEVYITPGLLGIILLFNGMQSSLSMVVDREMGSMRVLLTSPLPRSFLLFSKLMSIAVISTIQAYIFLAIASLFDVTPPPLGYFTVLPALILCALMLAAIGLFISSLVKQLENFAGVMNFVVFPMFFLSSALYPLWKMREANEWLYLICSFNPFTYAVELIRFSLYQQTNLTALVIVTLATFSFMIAAIGGYNPRSGLLGRKNS
jgi:ABC-2 type transport system permease protein